ncbi:hypothetical protein FCOIX_8083 [Fusarium coicis]|nr:hypothetical protein FCOIX_8083 [Fusarium coicis]
MGGTDLLRALESTVKRRVQDRESTQIIILTDGELEPEDSIQFIWKKRQLFGDSIRFFALGIGDEVSHRLVESIAECGGGYSDVVHTTQTPRWHDRLNRLLKSALEPNSWSCNIDLGSGFERKSLSDYKLEQQPTAESDKTPYIQAPFPISSLHPFSFASISFLIDLRHGGQPPKAQAPGNDGTIHRLVAKSVLLDIQDEIKRGTGETQIAKTNAEYIGTTYSITSKWTSFVAVPENQPAQTVEEQKMNHYKALFDEIDIDELLNNVSGDEASTCCSSSGSSCSRACGGLRRTNSPSGPRSWEDQYSSGAFSQAASDVRIPPRERVHEDSQSDSPPPIGEYTLAREVSAVATKRAPDESYAQEDTSPHGSEPAYHDTSELRHLKDQPAALKATDKENEKKTPVVVESKSGLSAPSRGTRTASTDVDGQPTSSEPYAPHAPSMPSGQFLRPKFSNRGLAIPAGIIKQGEPHRSNYNNTGKGMELSEEIELVQCHVALVGSFYDHALREQVSELPSPTDTCGVETYNSEAGMGKGSTHTHHMSPNPMPMSPTVFHPHSATSHYRRPGQAPLSQASPRPKAIPTPNPRCAPWQDCEQGYDSPQSPSTSLSVDGPLDWQFAMECQDGQDLFDLDEKRPSLHLHFCPETMKKFCPKIFELLSDSSTPQEERDDISARILDTLMMIDCYKTHRVQEEDTWDLMMERAWDAAISVLGLSDEEEVLEELAGQLRGAMMHAHYVAATGVKDSEKDESCTETVRCPACDVVWLTSRRFFCPLDHESDDVDEFPSWEDFWKHQVDQGHVVCPQEVV